MPTSLQGLVIVALAVLPGSTYTWAFERQVSAFGVTLADRTLRFISISFVFDALFAWPAYVIYREVVADGGFGYMEFAIVWFAGVVLAVVPAFAGAVLGGLYATRTDRTGWDWLRTRMSVEAEERLLTTLLGRTPAPRAWDNFFSDRPSMFVRVRTVDGFWIAGRFADSSYAGGFPNATDLFLEEAWEVDGEGTLGLGGLGYPVYVAAQQIAWLEFVRPVQDGRTAHVRA